MTQKLRKYQTLLVEELKDDQYNSAAWLSLALQLQNDGDHERHRICLERSVMTADNAYLPYRELAFLQLREGLATLVECGKRLTPSYPFAKICEDMISVLADFLPDIQVIDTEVKVSADLELPPFNYDNIAIVDDSFEVKNDKNVKQIEIEQEDIKWEGST